jgi:hypothetical protein
LHAAGGLGYTQKHPGRRHNVVGALLLAVVRFCGGGRPLFRCAKRCGRMDAVMVGVLDVLPHLVADLAV